MGAELDADLFLEIGRCDWYVTKTWNLLHYAQPEDISEERHADIAAEWAIPGPVRLACGRTAACLWIPGIFTRMGAMRCTGCCRAMGLPEGKGSPKNDAACRAILGLPAERPA
jgi:hypothetical protein